MSALSSAALLGAMPAAARRIMNNKHQRSSQHRSASLRCNAAAPVSSEERRLRETLRVTERTQEIHNHSELEAALTLAGDNLVMVAIESEEECTMSEDLWQGLSSLPASTQLESIFELLSGLTLTSVDSGTTAATTADKRCLKLSWKKMKSR